MKTGEGKTLVSTLAGYLNAIAGKGVHTSLPSMIILPSVTPSGWAALYLPLEHDRRSAPE